MFVVRDSLLDGQRVHCQLAFALPSTSDPAVNKVQIAFSHPRGQFALAWAREFNVIFITALHSVETDKMLQALWVYV